MENEMERTTGSDMDSGNVEGFIWIRVSKKLGALLWGSQEWELLDSSYILKFYTQTP